MRKRKCKHCGDPFYPWSTLTSVCSVPCAVEYGKVVEEKKRRRDLRDAKAKLKPRGQWAKEAQASFNAFIRDRDKYLPCISCGRFHGGQWQAGHYRTVGGHPELRFDERNCHRQCAQCNNHKSGDIVNYRTNLLERIGQAELDLIEGPHEPKHYTIEDFQSIKRDYRLKAKSLSM